MLKSKLFISVTAAFLASTAAVNAADVVYEPVVETPPAAVAYDWSGFYAGAAIGWIGVRPNSQNVNQIQPDSDGLTGGVFAGYNYQMGSFVLGAEADINANAASETESCANATFDCNAGSDWNGSVRLRAGVALDRVHVYGTGGFAFGDFYGYTDNGTRFGDSETLTGWVAGGGIEYAATEKLIVGVEALYSDFGDNTMQYDGLYEVSPSFTTVKFRAAMKF